LAGPVDGPAPGFASLTHFGGFDWAMEAHQFCLMDKQGVVLFNFSFADDAQGWAQLRARIAACVQASAPEQSSSTQVDNVSYRLGVTIETACGPAVERLLELGVAVYPVNPKAAERYRDRKAPSGVKSDGLDAWCFADALRTDGHAWRQLRPLDPATAELRMLCRDEIPLIEQRTALVLQLRAALHEYYPASLDAFEDWTQDHAWQFIVAFPTPDVLVNAGKRKWEKFLHAHKLYRPRTAQARLDRFASATRFASPSPAVTRAKSLLAVTLCKQLQSLQKQLNEYRRRINALFKDHPDSDCFGSLPGAGEKIAPRLLGELGTDRVRFESHESLQAYAGTAPVTQRSGKRSTAKMRRACNKTLRATVHLWADLSRPWCAWAQAYYQHKKQQGLGHAAALRCLGNRWLKILWKMWRTGKPYDEAQHTRNQIAHGSWVVRLITPAPVTTPITH
jgi:transposase